MVRDFALSRKRNLWCVLAKFFILVSVPIHSDFNDHNILVTRIPGSDVYEITGILDFGASLYGYRVFDIAIYMMHMLTLTSFTKNFGEVGRLCLAGYLQHQTLSESEYEVLFNCIMGRFLQCLVIGEYDYSLHEDEYFLTPGGWEAVEILMSASPADWLRTWRLPAQ